MRPTADGSFTLYSQRFQENCHSDAGAKEETLFHYLQGCQLEDLLQRQHEVVVLEIGFGTGLGARLTQEFFQAHKRSGQRLHFISTELDENLITWAWPELRRTPDDMYCFEQDGFTLWVLAGDAREGLRTHHARLPRAHAIYQDAFSPKRSPGLWTQEFFQLLGSLSAPDARLATYSASVSIRKALHAAGWGVVKGPAFGRKKSSTRARWQQDTPAELLAELLQHPTPALTDAALPKDMP